jgi:hypothetical protein
MKPDDAASLMEAFFGGGHIAECLPGSDARFRRTDAAGLQLIRLQFYVRTNLFGKIAGSPTLAPP